MKNTTERGMRFRRRFYLRLLQWLGFASAGFLAACDNDSPIQVMYGVPDNSIHFYGKVQSADSLKNIPGIQIRLVPEEKWDSVTTTTSSDGSYSFYYYAYEGDHLQIKFLDKDSLDNAGWFKDLSLDLEISGRDANNHEKETNVQLIKK